MKKAWIALAQLITLLSCSGSKETGLSAKTSGEKFFSRYLTPVIDGKMKDWGDTLLSYDASTKSIYCIANDTSNLYICIKAIDQAQQMKIIQGGMEIWIDDKMKRNKTTGIKFPLGGSIGQVPPEQNRGPDSKQMHLQAKLKMMTMELTGFRDEFNGKRNIYSDIPIKPVIDWDNKDDLIYELAIPFAALNNITVATLSNISIEIVIKGMSMDQGMPEGGIRRSPPAGGPPGGIRPGGTGGSMPDRSQMENMSKENSFWTKYTIYKN